MINYKCRAWDRLIAAVLAFIMLISTMPFSGIAAPEDYPNQFVITVTDTESTAVEGAEITYEIIVNNVSAGSDTTVTDADGTAGIDLSAYASNLANNEPIELKYTVSKSGYLSKSDTTTITSLTDNLGIVLEADSGFEMVTITSSAGEGGTILINDESDSSVAVDKDSAVSVQVEAANGYQIISVTIDDTPQTLTDLHSFSATITADSDINISAVFTKEYTVSVTYDDTTGTVTTDPATTGGSVVVATGTRLDITATPKEHYRVTKVKINDEEQSFEDNTYTSDNPWKQTLSVEQDYNIEVTFALVYYTITATSNENAAITIQDTKVDYNGGTVASIQANDGYNVTSVLVNGDSVDFQQTDNKTVQIALTNITEDKNIGVTTAAIATDATLNDVTISTAIRADEATSLYVYAKDTTAVVSTQKGGISINGISEDGSDFAVQSVDISETTTIESIYLYYDNAWHGVYLSTSIQIVIDSTEPELTLTPDEANSNGYYNDDVSVQVTAKDINNYSGLSSVEYYITNDEQKANVTQTGTLYSYDNSGDISAEVTQTITVDSALNNSDYVKVHVTVTDLAGNSYIDTCSLKINSTTPTISVEIDGTLHSEAETGYYNAKRMATITIVDRASTFDETLAEDGITISAVDADGDSVAIDKASMISWSHNGDQHIATVTFSTDANYEWSVSYTNKAGGSNTSVSATGDSVYRFTVDTINPYGSITVAESTWDKLLSILTFGLYSSDTVRVTATAGDATSPVEIEYYKTSNATQMSAEELDEQSFTAFEPFSVDADEQFVVYLKITDYAGNYIYINSDGYIVDATANGITLTPDNANSNGCYNGDVDVAIEVTDAEPYSGIKTVDYYVVKDGDTANPTQSGNLYTFGVTSPTQAELVNEWTGSITVDSSLNNSSNVTVYVTTVDNAGNEATQSVDLDIDITNPTIQVSFDNNNDNNGNGYFDAQRTATLVITDRTNHFNAVAATNGITITAEDAQGNTVENAYTISEWTTVEGATPDEATHTATIAFEADANYTLEIVYTDKADDVADEFGPISFTVDTTDPYGSITVAESTWDKLLSILTFGLYSSDTVRVTATADDATSPVEIAYYKTSNATQMSAEELDEQSFMAFETFSVDADEQFVVYLKITDYAGNYIYINSDGYIVDATANGITLTPDNANSNGCYNGDVDVAIEVTDAEPYSGIQSIEYWVECDGETTQQQTLYAFEYQRDDGINTNGGTLTITDWATGEEVVTEYEGDVPSQDQLKSEWTGSITVDSALNNSSNVTVYVKTVDNAGNEATQSVDLDIDITDPTIQVSFDNNDDNNGNSYFDAQRTATVVITERDNHFDADAATNGITITAEDAQGNTVENAYTISEWTTVEGTTPDEATHTATIAFEADANYKWSVGYTDKADNAAAEVNTGASVAPFVFTIDTVAPVGTVTATSAEGRVTRWSELISSLTFGFWSRETITVTATQDDDTSPIASVEYYKVVSENASDNTDALSATQLDNITTWQAFTSLTIGANEQFVVYLKIADNAGNYTYISTDGLIADDNAPLEETIAPEITVNPEQPVNGIYNGNVNVDIQVTDPLVGGTYSGLKTISYRVLNMGVETQSGTLYSFSETSPKQEDLLQTWTGTITVDSTLNNSNDVVIEVIAEDNSLNTSRESVSIQIDITAPTIEISYSNNDADSNSYFKADRTATIVVTERNFNANDVQITITNTDGVIPQLSGWTKTTGTGNEDDTRWTATIIYNADGDYTFGIAYTDLASNACAGAQYGSSVAPTAFTIDKTQPVISVTYDNNSAENTNYYKAERTATITITEHNFSADRVTITITATDDGSAATVPTVNGWSTNGDVHTATIYYAGDALYSFDISLNDMAGNASADFAEQTFYVDKTSPTLAITGVADKSANNGDVIPVITYSDTNYDSSRVTITLTGANRGSVELDGTYTDIHNGRIFTFNNFAMEQAVDDIYTLTATLTDKAGNTTEQTITFSVNRFGSVYTLSDSTKALNGSYVKVPQDVVITETNANALESITITLFKNNETIVLVEGEDYRIDVVGGDGQWYQYTYTIFAKNFADDGVYRLTVYSKDAAGNVAENTLDTKSTEISFGVDKTNPTLVVTNLESNTTYAVDNLTVIMLADDNLSLDSVVVYLDDDTTQYKTWNADEVAEILSGDGEFTFDISGDSTSAHDVRVVCLDAAGNEISQDITDFFVTTNLWVRYYTNKPLFFGSIAGVILLAAFIVFIVVWKKRKKEEE